MCNVAQGVKYCRMQDRALDAFRSIKLLPAGSCGADGAARSVC